ncbi:MULTISPECIES: anthranilate 1,2-dioxygenase regulatory protein AndR [Burkholderiaceae]|uniref:Transcriptional regulator, AraC family n=1 Tax=Caballeronia sordidicola TaxID=196367 RepID=A0A242MAX8_CABSO|nr:MULTISPECIES: anthranilate 1,2-dioxygenase regulatory protein AndR [Burkholderiaceae]AME28396.1 AraC family transcriptional regulator [Burkholderia sp. PAMC 26561]OTP67858.1 Transcriptional regulator, AraC family [Caballeronia sordidicola]
MSPAAFHADALRSYRLFESTDLDETRELISRVMQPHALVPAGSGSGRSYMDFVKLGGLGLGTIGFGDAMRVDVKAVDGYYLLMFCVVGEAEVRTMGRSMQVNRKQGVLCAPGQAFDAHLSPGSEQFVLRIDPVALELQTGLTAGELASVVPVGGVRLRGWMQQLELVASSAELLACARSNPGVAVQLERLLIDLFATGHAGQTAQSSGQAARPVSPAFIKRAEAFIKEHCSEPLELLAIANAAGVSVRTLHDGFQRFKGVSPMQFVRQLRLERARDALREAPANVRVAEIALDCGFTHLGRFAMAYKAIFGESPSDTLRVR